MSLARGAFALTGVARSASLASGSRSWDSGDGAPRAGRARGTGGRGALLVEGVARGDARLAARVSSERVRPVTASASPSPLGDARGGVSRGAPFTFNRGGSASSSSTPSSRLHAASSMGANDPVYSAYRRGANGSGGSRDDDDVFSPSSSSSFDVSGSGSFDSIAKPLKINQDILLWQARKLRSSALKIRKRDDRVRARLNSIRLYERAKAVDPSDGRAYVGMAQVLIALGDEDAARRCYQDGCDATGGDNAHLWQAWATLEERAGDVAKARQFYDAALAADKTHAAAWHGWATLEKKQGNFQRARDLLVKGVRVVPASRANPHLYHSLGVMALERGRIEEAREHFRAGTKTEAGARSAVLWQSWAMLESREPEQGGVARKLFQRALGVDPDNRYVWLAWATFEAKEGYVDRARSLLRKGVSSTPGIRRCCRRWLVWRRRMGISRRRARSSSRGLSSTRRTRPTGRRGRSRSGRLGAWIARASCCNAGCGWRLAAATRASCSRRGACWRSGREHRAGAPAVQVRRQGGSHQRDSLAHLGADGREAGQRDSRRGAT